MVARYFHYRPFSHPRNDGRVLTLNGKGREKSLGLGRNNAIKKVARLLSANQTGGAQFEFWATSETNFVWIGCTSSAQKTVSNSTQCLLFVEGLDKYIISEVTFKCD